LFTSCSASFERADGRDGAGVLQALDRCVELADVVARCVLLRGRRFLVVCGVEQRRRDRHRRLELDDAFALEMSFSSRQADAERPGGSPMAALASF
jgi:hypothetical protein